MTRRPRFAGSWYPAEAGELRRAVSEYISAGGPATPAMGLMAPHAGYVYSGPVAGLGYASVEVPATAIILAPAHRATNCDIAVWDGGDWETPLGVAPIDVRLRDAILAGCDRAEPDSGSHLAEHSLELQVPFLQVRRPDVRIVPILVATIDVEALAELGRACAAAIRSIPDARALIVASSDMTHYESAESARRKDGMALERVREVDPAGLLDVVRRGAISMCGVAPTAAMLFAAKELGPCRGDIVAYGSSGDVTGEKTEVVGYGTAAVRPA